ncbi:hypothetical protein BJ508DRAFT_322224 [Ascobolus immersus RN42]|uniref:Mitochondrial K+-H+ exchange-related-domain-containing protein n=1 Tax=Ascobolus immersus RN42 TaxID=1160509 RepID=A0A3N4IN04_ASCIM|nr:hypothetical protein BJ508DRAFT_322224 [Ascobolus immersus RN42]
MESREREGGREGEKEERKEEGEERRLGPNAALPPPRLHQALPPLLPSSHNLAKTTITPRQSHNAAQTWLSFEQAPSGWKKSLTTWGNSVVARIPFEEWSLRSIPPASYRKAQLAAQKKSDLNTAVEETADNKVVLLYPKAIIHGGESAILKRLEEVTAERLGVHKKSLVWNVVGMPIVAPFALVPVIPNIPFFYLAYRAYCNYTAYQGGLHLQSLLRSNSILTRPSPELDDIYKQQPVRLFPSKEITPSGKVIGEVTESSEQAEIVEDVLRDGEEERMVLTLETARVIGERLGVPDLAVECERAVRQVEKRIEEDRVKKAAGVKKEN